MEGVVTPKTPVTGARERTLPRPLGVRYAPEQCAFAVVAEAVAARIRLTHPGTRETRVFDLQLDDQDPLVWWVEAPGDWRHWSYSIEIERDGTWLGDIVDPWATLVRDGRAYVTNDTTAVTPRPPMQIHDAVIYELHIRDFTRDSDCGVRPDWRGRFLGLTESGTTVAGTTYTSGLDHIVELGVTVVQLMPVHAFAMPYHPEYEWGYMPNDFNAPHAGYASGVELDAPIRELKRMISALHERGLRVTLDVVYNHTAEKWPNRLRSLMALAPRTYFRFKDDGAPWDGSACGNEFRSESEHGRRFLIESCLYWVREFGVDGFRFDLMGLIDEETMAAITSSLKAEDPSILVYGEPWAAGPTPIDINGKGKQRGNGWAVFNDDFRDGLRGEVFVPESRGFLAEGSQIDRVKSALRAGVTAFADSPLETINYIECHDNHTLHDRLGITAPAAHQYSEEQRMEMNALGALMLLTSQGIPFLHSGQEFGRSKEGQENTFNLGDQINNIRWADKSERISLYSFYRQVIRLRREHPLFRLTTREQVLQAVRFLDDDLRITMSPGSIGCLVEDVTGADPWLRALLLFNGSREKTRIRLPAPTEHLPPGAPGVPVRPARRATDDPSGAFAWRIWAMDGHIVSPSSSVSEFLDLPAHWGAVLFVER